MKIKVSNINTGKIVYYKGWKTLAKDLAEMFDFEIKVLKGTKE